MSDRPRAPFVVTVVLAGAALTGNACGPSEEPPIATNPPYWEYDSGVADVAKDGTPDTAGCPANEPAIGAACTTGTCSYENLCPQAQSLQKTNTYRCTAGKWRFENTLESPIDCPKSAPRNGEACGCAMFLPSACTYGSDEAVCDGATQKWIVKAPFADAGSDAPTAETATDATPEAASDAASD